MADPIYVITKPRKEKRTIKQQFGRAAVIVAGLIMLLFVLAAWESCTIDTSKDCEIYGKVIVCT